MLCGPACRDARARSALRGCAGTAAGTHGVVAQRRSRLLAPLSHELGGVVAEQEAARAARLRARHRSGVDSTRRRRRNKKGPKRKSKMQQTDFRQPDRILFFFRARENVSRCIAAAPKKSGIGAVLSEFAGLVEADRPK